MGYRSAELSLCVTTLVNVASCELYEVKPYQDGRGRIETIKDGSVIKIDCTSDDLVLTYEEAGNQLRCLYL